MHHRDIYERLAHGENENGIENRSSDQQGLD